jgi:hypothetical protein
VGLGRLEKPEEVSVCLTGQGGAVSAITKQSIVTPKERYPNTAVLIMIQSIGRILRRNPDKSLKSFPPCYSQSPLQLFALRFLFLQTHATSYNFCSSVRRRKVGKPDRKAHLLPYGLRKSIQKPEV